MTTTVRYVCLRCGKKFGLAQTADDSTPKVCPACNAPERDFAMIEEEEKTSRCN